MSFFSRLLGYEDDKKAPVRQQPSFYNEDIPGAFDLGLHYSENKNEIRVAKVSGNDRRTHLYVLGSSGTGKTRLLSHIIRQDIVKGNGFALIDPHGDLFYDTKCFIASRCIDNPELSDNVIIIDPTDTTHSVIWNPLEPIPGVSVAEQAEELIGAFRKIWSEWGIRMEHLLRNSLIALGEAELTLCELSPFLTRRSFRRIVLEKVDNPTAIEYFRRFDSMTDRSQISWIEPILNKTDSVLANERIRHMFSSPHSTFNLREAMDTKKHILINLNKGKLKGSASDILGALLMAKITMTAFSRSDIEQHQRVPFCLYIDEFQNFATDSFKVSLSEARKFNLSLVLAHQSLAQINDDLREIILSNVGLEIFFRTNRKDSQLIAREIFPYSGSWEREIKELQDLPPRTFIAKHQLQGGIMRLRTQDVKSAHEMPGQNNLSRIGMKYMLPREELIAQSKERRKLIEEAAKAASPAQPQKAATKPPVAVSEPILAENTGLPDIEEPKPVVQPKQPIREPARVTLDARLPDVSFISTARNVKVEREHRKLQHLIKRLAEEVGYLATIEQPTADGQGRVDIGLEQDGKKIACEICVTTPPEHELQNIRKCLASGYDTVILCSHETKTLNRVKTLCSKELTEPELQKVLFLEPDAIALYFEEEAARNAGKTTRLKGYKVKIDFRPQSESDKDLKRQVITQVVMDSFKPKK